MGETVIVLDASNYKASYVEEIPFKARIESYDDLVVNVFSLATGKRYELYSYQILEYLHIDEIREIIDMSKWGVSEKP